MTDAAVSAIATLIATILGGMLVMSANWLTERRKDRRDEADQLERNAALMTATFVVRNFLVESLNDMDDPTLPFGQGRIGGLKAAQRNLDYIITKSPPEVQYIMASIFGLSLRLGDLVSALDHGAENDEIKYRSNLLEDAISEFDIYAEESLSVMNADQIRELVNNPEDVPD